MWKRRKKSVSDARPGHVDGDPADRSEWQGGGAHPPATDAPAVPDAAAHASAEEPPERDVLADVLRSLGTHAFDLDDAQATAIRARFEAWARHVLLGESAPGRDGPARAVDAAAARGERRREWSALRHDVAQHREHEHRYVTASMSAFREVIWIFIQGLDRAIEGDRAADTDVAERIARLRAAAGTGDPARLVEAALDAVDLVEHAIEERRQRGEQTIRLLSGRVDAMTGELHKAREQMSRDTVTGLYSRAALDEQLERLLHLGRVFGQPATLFMIDVDHFKWVNDRFGHPAGDSVLEALGGMLQDVLACAEDFAARYGGDELAVLVPDDDERSIRALGERLLFATRDLEIEPERGPIRVSLSIGAASLRPGDDLASWKERADAALYAAKEAGRDRMVLAADPDGDAPPAV